MALIIAMALNYFFLQKYTNVKPQISTMADAISKGHILESKSESDVKNSVVYSSSDSFMPPGPPMPPGGDIGPI